MNIRKTIIQTLFILLLSVLLGFANNYINDKGIRITLERPATDVAADSTFANDEALPSEPVALSKTQLKELLARDAVVVIDTRSAAEFASGHISGAINIPFDHLGEHIDKVDALPADKWLVPYCEGPPCDKGQQLAFVLADMGFDKVAYYDAGLDDWTTTEDVAQ